MCCNQPETNHTNKLCCSKSRKLCLLKQTEALKCEPLVLRIHIFKESDNVYIGHAVCVCSCMWMCLYTHRCVQCACLSVHVCVHVHVYRVPSSLYTLSHRLTERSSCWWLDLFYCTCMKYMGWLCLLHCQSAYSFKLTCRKLKCARYTHGMLADLHQRMNEWMEW